MTWLGVSDIKQHLGGKGDTNDVMLAAYADVATTTIEEYTESVFSKRQEFIETFEYTDRSVVLKAPTIEVIEVREILSNHPIEHFELDGQTGILTFENYFNGTSSTGRSSRYSRGLDTDTHERERLKITYIAGMDKVPHAVIAAGAMIVQQLIATASGQAGLASERDGDYSYSRFSESYGDGLMTPTIRQMLRPYRCRRVIVQ